MGKDHIQSSFSPLGACCEKTDSARFKLGSLTSQRPLPTFTQHVSWECRFGVGPWPTLIPNAVGDGISKRAPAGGQSRIGLGGGTKPTISPRRLIPVAPLLLPRKGYRSCGLKHDCGRRAWTPRTVMLSLPFVRSNRDICPYCNYRRMTTLLLYAVSRSSDHTMPRCVKPLVILSATLKNS